MQNYFLFIVKNADKIQQLWDDLKLYTSYFKTYQKKTPTKYILSIIFKIFTILWQSA